MKMHVKFVFANANSEIVILVILRHNLKALAIFKLNAQDFYFAMTRPFNFHLFCVGSEELDRREHLHTLYKVNMRLTVMIYNQQTTTTH
jgi:hypothetical protein